MRSCLLGLLLITSSCVFSSDVPRDAMISCTMDAHCPPGLQCVEALGRCVSQELSCDDEGAPCTVGGKAGICVQQVCMEAGCGNGFVEDSEVCDDGNTESGDGCSADCRSTEVCGNGVRDVNEGCDCGDGSVELPTGCQGPNADTPDSLCLTSCRLPGCGDGLRAGLEACDGADLGDATCSDLGYYEAPGLGCSEFCTFDASACQGGRCGDGEVNPGEACDGDDLGGMTCLDFGYHGPAGLSCNSACRFELQGCEAQGYCGDGVKNGDEVCDGAWLDGRSCVDFGFDFGVVTCGSQCVPQFAACGSMGWRADTIVLSVPTTLTSLSAAHGDYALMVGGGTSGPVLSTYQGGTWTVSHLFAEPLTLQSVDVASPTRAITAGGETVLTLNDSGWSRYDSTSVPARSLWAVALAGDDAVAVGNGVLHHRSGVWTDATPEDFSGYLFAAWASGPDDIWAVGTSGMFARYDGQEWSLANHGTAIMRAVWGARWDDVWAAGDTGVVWHFDGASWTQTMGPTTVYEQAVGVSGTGRRDVWIMRRDGTSIRFDGERWVKSDPLATGSSGAASFVSPRPDVAFAHFGGTKVYRRVGASWSRLTETPFSANARLWASAADDIWVAQGTHGDSLFHFDGDQWSNTGLMFIARAWGLGQKHVLAWSDDELWAFDGGDWSLVDTGSVELGEAPYGAHGLSSAHYWLLHFEGLVRVENGTFTYFDILSGRLKGVWMVSPTDVWFVGADGSIVHYDGGEPMLVPSPTTRSLNALWGAGPDDLWAVGDAGIIVHYDGVEWTTVASPTSNDLFSVWGSGPQDIWASGAINTLLHYDGVRWSPVRSPATGIADITGVGGTARHIVVQAGGHIYLLDRARALVCAEQETACGNAVDDDCDGAIDEADSDCAGRVVINEVFTGAVPSIELVNRSSAPAPLGGLELLWRQACGGALRTHRFMPEVSAPGGGTVRVLDQPNQVQRGELQTFDPFCGPATLSGWVALCAGACDLKTCVNFLDYVEVQGTGVLPETPACASMVSGPVSISGATAGQSTQRVDFAGFGPQGVRDDWAVQTVTRD